MVLIFYDASLLAFLFDPIGIVCL